MHPQSTAVRTCTVCDDSDGRHHAIRKNLTSVWPLLDVAAWQEVYAAHCDFLARLHAIVERSCYRDGLRKSAGRKPRGRPREGASDG